MVTYRNFEWMIHHLLQAVGSDEKHAVDNGDLEASLISFDSSLLHEFTYLNKSKYKLVDCLLRKQG